MVRKIVYWTTIVAVMPLSALSYPVR